MLRLGPKSFDLYENHLRFFLKLDILIVRDLKAVCISHSTPTPDSAGTCLPLYNNLARLFAVLCLHASRDGELTPYQGSPFCLGIAQVVGEFLLLD